MQKFTSRVLIIFVLSFVWQGAQAQINEDSLWGVWEDEGQPDTNRFQAMVTISQQGYLFTQPDSTIRFAQMLQDLAHKKNNEKFKATAIYIQALAHFIQGNFETAMELSQNSLKIRSSIGDKVGTSASLSLIGKVHAEQGNLEDAIVNFTKSLQIAEELNDIYQQSITLSNIGKTYEMLGENEKALDLYEQSLQFDREMGDKRGESTSLINVAVANDKLGRPEKTELHFNEALAIMEEIGDRYGMAFTLLNLGAFHQREGNIDKAIDFFSQSLKLSEELGDKEGAASTLGNLAILYNGENELEKGIESAKTALTIAQEIGSLRLTEQNARSLWKMHKELGNYGESLKMYEIYIQMSDSLASMENQKAVIRQEYKYEYEKQAAADSVRNAEAAKVKDAELSAERAENDKQRQQSYFLYGGLALTLLFGGFIFNRFRLTRKQRDIIEGQKQEVETQKQVVEEQKTKVDQAYEQLEEKNTEILDSINYAKRIQSAILPPDKLVKQYLRNSFVLYKPKDIVAGDFYWCEPQADKILFAAADCTGHGVPGAMVSVVCNNGLNRSVREYGLTDPGDILSKTREIVISEFEKSEEEVKDGMDVALCVLEGNTLKYAGAHNPLWIIRKNSTEIEEVKAHKQPIGQYEQPTPYPTHTVELNPGDSFYIFTDGFADQFGGDRGKKFKAANFKRLLASMQEKSMDEQRELIDEAFENWKGDLEQLDDVCVIGVRI